MVLISLLLLLLLDLLHHRVVEWVMPEVFFISHLTPKPDLLLLVRCSHSLLWFLSFVAAIVSGGKGTAQDKIKSLNDAGVKVVESPAKIGAAMYDLFKERGLLKQ